MASQALYRRYRSQTFDELIGQEHIVQTLRNAIADGRIAHAYLFTGPRGVGKTTVARLMAKAVNCTAPATDRPCGVCEMCQAVADGSAVDVIEMDAASHTSVEDAREIIERVQFRPTQGRYKVYIIDETHMLSTAAFNALLKTLEEPPAHALFILATTEIHKVPATILSRCQRFTFNRHSIASTAIHLREISAQEGFTLEPGTAEAIARAATGSMRDALSILDQLMAYGSATISVEQVRGLLGSTESGDVHGLTEALIGADVAAGLRVVASVAARGADLRQFTRDLVERLRALLLLKASGDASLLDLSDDEFAVLQDQAARADLGAVLGWTRLFGELDHQLRTSPYGQLPLEMAVVEAIAAPAPARSVAVAPTRPAASTRPASPPVQRPAPVTAAPVAAAPVREPEPVDTTPAEPQQSSEAIPVVEPPDVVEAVEAIAVPLLSAEQGAEVEAANADAAMLEYVEQIWPEVIRDVRVYDKTLQALLNSGVKPVDIKQNTVVLEVATDWLLTRIESPKQRQLIEKVLSRHMQGQYLISCIVAAQRRENPNVLREQIRTTRKDPLVRAAINIFDADILRVETYEEGS
ncbi:MAG: DNA polymerase III subunit gamma/tau [Roseiflexaceae bacterium]